MPVVTATTSSGRTISMNVSAGIAKAAATSGSNAAKAGISAGGGSSKSSTPTPESTFQVTTPTGGTANVSPGIAATIAKGGLGKDYKVTSYGGSSQVKLTFPSGQTIVTSPAVAATLVSPQFSKNISTPQTSTTPANRLVQQSLISGTSTSPISMPKVDTSLMSPAEKIKYYYQQADIKLGGYLPGGKTPSEVALGKGTTLQQEWFGKTPQEEKYYFGDKEYTLGREYATPTMEGKGTSIINYGKVEDIKPDYDVGIVRKLEQYIPIASVPITAWREQVYLTSEADVNKFNDLISKKTSTELITFLRDKQYEYKKDLGRYNLLSSVQDKLTESEQKELNKLYSNLASSYSNRGTFRDVVLSSTKQAEAEGKTVKILGKEIKPTTVTAALGGTLAAYEVEKQVLPFTLGFAGASSLIARGGALGRGLSVLATLEKPLRWTVAPLGLGSGVAEGYKEFKETGDLKYSVASGLGTSAGFFAGLYPKQTINYAIKPFKEVGKGVRNVLRAELGGELKGLNKPRTGNEFIVGKRGSQQVMADEYTELGGLKTKKKKRSLIDFTEEKYYSGWEYLNNKIRKDPFGNVIIRPTTNAEKFERIRNLWNKLDKTDSKKVKDFIKFIRETAGDDILRDFISQEGLLPISKVEPPVKPSEPTLGGIYKTPEGSPYFGQGLYETTKFPPRVKPKKPDRTAFDFITGSEDRKGIFGAGLFFGGMFGNRDRTGLGTGGRFGDLTDTRDRTGLAEPTDLGTPTIEVYKQPEPTTERFFTPSPEVETQLPEQPITLITPSPNIIRPRPEPPKPFEPIKPVTFDFPEERKKKPQPENKPYDAQVFVDATKGQKARWQTVADNVPLITALSKGGQFVDDTASNRFRVVPQKGKVNRIIDTAWNQLSNKFREYSQKSGIKVGLKPGNYIEKRKFRIDSPNERRAIPLAGQATIARRFR